jgi:hypothetical protein
MGDKRNVEPVKLVCGMISADERLIRQTEQEMEGMFGAIDIRSELFPFNYTDYYSSEMGVGLLRKFVSFDRPIDPMRLASIKIETNGIERKLAVQTVDSIKRRINLDPGYVTPVKLVLATTKDFAHRIYLGDGIYAEVTLNFKKNGCAFFEWTYPDFKSGIYVPFLLEARRKIMAHSK